MFAEEQMAACKRFYAEPEVFVLDVRSREEVAETGTLSKAVNIPHLELETEEALAQLPSSKDTPVLVFCKSGYRSGIAEQVSFLCMRLQLYRGRSTQSHLSSTPHNVFCNGQKICPCKNTHAAEPWVHCGIRGVLHEHEPNLVAFNTFLALFWSITFACIDATPGVCALLPSTAVGIILAVCYVLFLITFLQILSVE